MQYDAKIVARHPPWAHRRALRLTGRFHRPAKMRDTDDVRDSRGARDSPAPPCLLLLHCSTSRRCNSSPERQPMTARCGAEKEQQRLRCGALLPSVGHGTPAGLATHRSTLLLLLRHDRGDRLPVRPASLRLPSSRSERSLRMPIPGCTRSM